MIKENILKRNLKKQSKKIVFLTIFIAICIFSIYQIQKNSSQLLSSSSKFLSKLDLNIQKIKIEGTNNSKGVDIIRALDLNNDTLLINFNLQEASKRIHIPLVVDIVDDFSLFSKQSIKREKFYKKNKYIITKFMYENDTMKKLNDQSNINSCDQPPPEFDFLE